MATIKDVAKLSGYSITTVSRVLNNDPNLSVSGDTREKIFAVAEELKYKKKLLKPLIKNIAFLYWLRDGEELEDIYFQSIRVELEKLAKQYNVELTTFGIEEGIEKIPDDLEGFVAVGTFSDQELTYLRSITPNGVFVDSSPDPSHFDSVMPNLEQVTKRAIDFFIEKGHKDIGFIGGTIHNTSSDENITDIREQSFRQYMTEKGLLNEDYIFCQQGFAVDGGYHLMKGAIETLGDQLPTAFFTATDSIAVGCLQVLNESGIAIPNRVSIVSVNNLSVAKYVSPPLTTFHIDFHELCKNALTMLIERVIEKRKVVKTLYIGSELVCRKSTK